MKKSLFIAIAVCFVFEAFCQELPAKVTAIPTLKKVVINGGGGNTNSQTKVIVANTYDVDFPCLLSNDGKEWSENKIPAKSEATLVNVGQIRFSKSSDPDDKTERAYRFRDGKQYRLAFDSKTKTWDMRLGAAKTK